MQYGWCILFQSSPKYNLFCQHQSGIPLHACPGKILNQPEIVNAIKKPNAPGHYKTQVEYYNMWNQKDCKCLLYKICSKAWCKCRVPVDWQYLAVIFFAIYKNDNSTICWNYRGITNEMKLTQNHSNGRANSVREGASKIIYYNQTNR